jgi:chorismate synthase
MTGSNHSGGVLGGISNGMPIYFNVAFKPVSSVKMEQQTIDKSGKAQKIVIEGRHDPCVLPRAVPIVEAMAALVMADCLLLSASNRL